MKKEIEVVMLPTNEKALLWINHLKHGKLNLSEFEMPFNTAQHLYFLSDEEIKEEHLPCYIYHKGTNSVQYIDMVNVLKEANKEGKKIIATTDNYLAIDKYYPQFTVDKSPVIKYLPQPSQSFIEHYVSEYNKGNRIAKVLVEYIPLYDEDNMEYIEQLKINSDNTINIKTIKDSWSREEVIDNIYDFHKYFNDKIIEKLGESCLIRIDKWIEENL